MALSWAVLVGPIVKVGGDLFAARRFKVPPIVFGQPEPRDNGAQRWWHIPVYIKKPEGKLMAFFAQLEILDVRAEVTVDDWRRDIIAMRWQSDGLDGAEAVTLSHHPTKLEPLINYIPVAIRRSVPGGAFKAISLDAGETYLSDRNFILYGTKDRQAFLDSNKEYTVTVRLWSTKHRRWSVSKNYTLRVPINSASNQEFLLS